MNANLGRLMLVLACTGAPTGIAAQTRPLVRLEGGMLNPDEITSVASAFGAAVGVGTRSSAFLVRFERQGWDRDFGSGRTHARSFALLDWEHAIGRHDQPQAFFRLGAGALFHPPLQTTWAVDAAIGLRYRLVPWMSIVGSAGDLAPCLQHERILIAGTFGGAAWHVVPQELQHNLSVQLSLEVRP